MIEMFVFLFLGTRRPTYCSYWLVWHFQAVNSVFADKHSILGRFTGPKKSNTATFSRGKICWVEITIQMTSTRCTFFLFSAILLFCFIKLWPINFIAFMHIRTSYNVSHDADDLPWCMCVPCWFGAFLTSKHPLFRARSTHTHNSCHQPSTGYNASDPDRWRRWQYVAVQCSNAK